MRQSLHNYFLSHALTEPEEREEFSKFAFGKDYKETSLYEFRNRWNEMHGEKYFLKGDGKVVDDLTKMIEIWKQTKE